MQARTIPQYRILCPFQHLFQQMLFPVFLIRNQTAVKTQLQEIQRKVQFQQKAIQPKQQQQQTSLHLKIQPTEQKPPCNTKKGIKFQEKSVSVANPTQKKTREADAFTQRRNILPNNINHVLAFIQRKSKSGSLVRRIVQKAHLPPTFTVKNYYCYQAYLKQKLHIHVNKNTLGLIANHLDLTGDIFPVQEQLFYNRVSRTLISYYIRQMAKIQILSSSRVKCTNKLDHLRAHRLLMQYLVRQSDQ